MSQATLVVLVIFNLIALGFTLYVWRGPYTREGRKSDRYKLFSVRDQIIWLVATKKISQDDKAFEFLYHQTNELIPTVRPFQLKDFVSIVNNKMPLQDEDEREKIIHEILQHKDSEVRTVGKEFFQALADILFKRSLLVKLMEWGLKGLILSKNLQIISKKMQLRFFKSQADTYRLYKHINSLAHQNS